MPTRHLHISSGQSGIFGFGGADLIEEARAHAATQTDAEAVEIDTEAALFGLLDRLRGENAQLESLDFHTHGGSGEIGLGSYTLTHYSWRLQFRNYHELFARNARIEFHGCSVATGANGEVFLADCGSTLLRSAGGRVTGHVGLTIATRAWGIDSTTPTYTGSAVHANVSRGGGVVLEGASYLLPHRLRGRLENLRRDLERARRRRQSPSTIEELRQASEKLDRAERRLQGQPSYRNVWLARNDIVAAWRLIPRGDEGYTGLL